MQPGDPTADSSAGYYPPTLWTQILEARKGSRESEAAWQELVGKADRSRARFRSLLATVLQRFINSELRRRYALKPGSGRPPVALDTTYEPRLQP